MVTMVTSSMAVTVVIVLMVAVVRMSAYTLNSIATYMLIGL